MVNLAFFDNLPISPPPSPPYNVGSACPRCPPWSNIVWGEGGRGGGGEGQGLEKEPLSSLNKGDDENTAHFQGVPYTFGQDCSRINLQREIKN